MVIVHPDQGVVPGYSDWIIESELDQRDMELLHQTYYDDMGQTYRGDDNGRD